MGIPDDAVNVSFPHPKQAKARHTGTCLLLVLKSVKEIKQLEFQYCSVSAKRNWKRFVVMIASDNKPGDSFANNTIRGDRPCNKSPLASGRGHQSRKYRNSTCTGQEETFPALQVETLRNWSREQPSNWDCGHVKQEMSRVTTFRRRHFARRF